MLTAHRESCPLVLHQRKGRGTEPLDAMTSITVDPCAIQSRLAAMRVGMAARAASKGRLGAGHRAAVARLATHDAVFAEQGIACDGMVEVAAINHVKPPRYMAAAATR